MFLQPDVDWITSECSHISPGFYIKYSVRRTYMTSAQKGNACEENAVVKVCFN